MKKTILTAGILLGLSAPAWGQTGQNCTQIANDSARLACYDAAFNRVTIEAEIADFGTPPPPAPEDIIEANGSNDRIIARSEEGDIDRVEFPIARLRRLHSGALVITLANGQVWQQTDPTTPRVPRAGVSTATIQRAAMGSFRMKFDSGRMFRVKRVDDITPITPESITGPARLERF